MMGGGACVYIMCGVCDNSGVSVCASFWRKPRKLCTLSTRERRDMAGEGGVATHHTSDASVPISALFGGLVTCPEVFMHFGFLHSFWTLVCLGLYRCSRIEYASDFLSLSFSFFSSVDIIHFATISVVHVVMDIFINQGASL